MAKSGLFGKPTEARHAEWERVKAMTGRRGVVGGGMIAKDVCVNQGDLCGRQSGVHVLAPKNPLHRSQRVHKSYEAP